MAIFSVTLDSMKVTDSCRQGHAGKRNPRSSRSHVSGSVVSCSGMWGWERGGRVTEWVEQLEHHGVGGAAAIAVGLCWGKGKGWHCGGTRKVEHGVVTKEHRYGARV